MKSIAICFLITSAVSAAEFIPAPGTFPPAGAGHQLTGELVSIDHVNRRGGLLLEGDGSNEYFMVAPVHRFALLPYASVHYHGATAELVHVPLGTRLHGTFFLPPKDDTLFPPASGKREKYTVPYNYSVLLEDDVSFHKRLGQSWKIGKLGKDMDSLSATLTGPGEKGDMEGWNDFSIDGSTRVWKANGFAELSDIRPGQLVQMNLVWRPGRKTGDYHVADIWLDEESLERAADRQAALHLRHTKYRWMPARIDDVEYLPDQKGIVTFTLFSGQDPSLYESIKNESTGGLGKIAIAEPTLRTYWLGSDSQSGALVDPVVTDDPPPGSSGLQIRIKVNALLEGFQPGRIVRIWQRGFSSKILPSEERLPEPEVR